MDMFSDHLKTTDLVAYVVGVQRIKSEVRAAGALVVVYMASF